METVVPRNALDVVDAGAERPAEPPLRTLPEQIAERIYNAIIAGEYQPGERIREEALAEAYGVSRGPVREALRILERDSVVRVLANKGAHVTKLSTKEVNDTFEIRMVLAGAMVRRLGSAPPALIARFAPKVEELERLASAPDEGAAYVAASVELALGMAQASGNERLTEIMRSLARQSWRYTRLALAQRARRQQSAQHWRTLFNALLAGRAEEAGCAMERLVDDSRREAVRQLGAGP
ncbi:hypothetical protein DAI43_17640 [Achromobacter xylosoxidans]|uniref:GntR family transcriptional regulator n=1 Tax=Achromobacter aegrifaciens TaxID=1287736 RepID=UPI000D4604B8|nr:GntR family transcriptional regulator [Achromobacter aegrifaciens]MDQ1764363.1 GntR family transcriptional regulator [Achromobacter aegrifaciens]PTN50327.1 hypothetical protein DAI43_17640 [Achromobacter xylosoxidans]